MDPSRHAVEPAQSHAGEANIIASWHTRVMSRRAFLVSITWIAACGDDASGIELEASPAAYASAYCERALACCETVELQTMLGMDVVDRASCEMFITRIFGNEFIDDTRRAIQLDRAGYDPIAMAACAEHVRNDDCIHVARVLRLMTFPRECALVRIGRVAVGGECDHDFQCVTGACAGGADHSAGQCIDVPAIGAPCPTGDCGASAYCDRTGATAVCASIESEGGTCASSLGCESLQCTAGTCAPPTSCDGR